MILGGTVVLEVCCQRRRKRGEIVIPAEQAHASRCTPLTRKADEGTALDAELLARLLHDGRNGGVVHVTRGREQVVLDLVAQAAADEVPERGAAAEVGGGFDLELGPIYCHLIVGARFVPARASAPAKLGGKMLSDQSRSGTT